MPAPTLPDATTTLADREAALLETAQVAVERHEVMAGDTRLHYLTCGEGEPLVMLHGRGCAAGMFAPLFADLAARRRVYAVDMPGWGLSDKPPFTGRTATDALNVWMDGVLGFLDALGLEHVDLLGHSMGGFAALGLALEHPEHVNQLVLLDSGGLGVNLGLDLRLYFWLKPERLNSTFGSRFFDATLRSEFVDNFPASGPLHDFLFAAMSNRDVLPSGATAFNAWVNLSGVHLDFRGRLRELSMPVLLLWGDRDRVTPYSDALKAARRNPQLKLVAVSRSGHFPFLERPTDVARVLNMWLDGDLVASRV